jgi:putative transposase
VNQKREVVQKMTEEGYPIMSVCELLELPRSTYYYHPVQVDEAELKKAIKDLAGQFPTYGTRRITHQLRRPPYEIHVNRKRVRRVMTTERLLRPQNQRRKRTTDSQHPYPRYTNRVKDLEITYPEQVWVSDVTYIRLKNDFVYLAIIMDVYTRALRGWCLSRTLDQELSLTALRAALAENIPEIHHSDQGVHYAAHAYIDLLLAHGIRISMAAVGKAEENGYAERVIRTIKEEEVDLSEYFSFSDAAQQIGYFIEVVYMTKRIHSSLGYLTPAEFELAYRLAQTESALAHP